MCAIRRGCCEGRVPEKCLKIIGARAAECVCASVCVCVGRLEGGMGDRDVKEERWPVSRRDEETKKERVLCGEIKRPKLKSMEKQNK